MKQDDMTEITIRDLEKLEKINQIIDSADIKTWGESSIVIRIREVLEKE
jgi:hypothetical protein